MKFIYYVWYYINKERGNDNAADILDSNVSVKNGNFICNVYDKRDKFNFAVVRLTAHFSNQSDNIGYCTFASQVIRFAIICNNIDGVRVRVLFFHI